MLAEGHPEAGDYPIPRVWFEAELVKERKDHALVMLAVVVQKATATTGMCGGKEAVKDFNDFIKGLSEAG